MKMSKVIILKTINGAVQPILASYEFDIVVIIGLGFDIKFKTGTCNGGWLTNCNWK